VSESAFLFQMGFATAVFIVAFVLCLLRWLDRPRSVRYTVTEVKPDITDTTTITVGGVGAVGICEGDVVEINQGRRSRTLFGVKLW
jgi:hypothetical protein